jgi:hypothetical protein
MTSCLVVALLHFLLQAWPRLANPFFGVDGWRHMLAADFLRRRRALPRESLPNYLFTGPFDYPPALIALLALLPDGARMQAQRFLSPAVEAAHGALVFLLVRHWTGDAAAAALAQAVFALTPITALENSQLNARGLGSLLLTVALVGSVLGAGGAGAAWLAAALAAGALAPLAHKMAAQTLLLFSLLSLPFLTRLWPVVLVGPLSLAVFFAVFRGLARRIAEGHLAVLRYHRRALRGPPAKTSAGVESRSFTGRLAALARSNPLVAALGSDPWIAPAAAALALGGAGPLALPAGRLMVFWLGAVYALVFGTALVRPLRFLGDGPRYSYYLAFPVAVLGGPALATAARGPHGPAVATLAAAVAAAALAEIVALQFRGVVRDTERSCRGDLRRIAELLRRAPEARAAVFPLCAAEVLACFSGCRVLSTDSALAHAENADFMDFNPRLRKPLDYFLEKYRITHVALGAGFAAGAGETRVPDSFERVFEGKDFSLWARRGRTA